MRKILMVLALGGIVALSGSQVQAACGSPFPMQNFTDSTFICSDNVNGLTSPVSAYAWQLGAAATTNTGPLKIACEKVDPSVNCTAAPSNNGPADNHVTIETDWSTPGVVGCPVDTAGAHRVVISIQCDDGKNVLFSLAGSDPNFGYQVELGYVLEADGVTIDPFVIGDDAGRPHLQSFTRAAGTDTVAVQIPAPFLHTDCDPNTYGQAVDGAFGTINCSAFLASPPALARGRLFTSTQACNTRPNIQLAAWTLATAQPDATGAAALALTTPPVNTTSPQCNFVGTTSSVGGNESTQITAFLQIGAQNVSSPVAQALKALRNAGNVGISFKTTTEIGLAGFNIIASGNGKELKLNAALIAPRGSNGGGAAYTLDFRIGEFKGSRSVIVESVLTNGTTLRSGSASF